MVIKAIPAGGISCQLSDFNLLIDPCSQVKGSLILKTKTEFPIKISFADAGIIQGAGEYEISGVKVRGIGLENETTAEVLRTIYAVEMDNLRLCFLGTLNSELSEDVIEKLGEVDVLFIPIGKNYIDAKKGREIIKQIEPKAVIPTTPDIKTLAEELGQKPEFQEKWAVKKKDLEGEGAAKLIWIVK